MGKPVSVFICGAQKAGTTTLHGYLRQHRQISASGKELHFFDDETRDWDNPDYQALESLFPVDDGDRLRFEATPIYAYWPPALPRLHSYNPHAKLIMLFRDPFERAWSQWCMEYGRNNETLPFGEAIRREAERLETRAPLDSGRRIYSYMDRGRYAGQMKRMFALFPKHQVLLMRAEDLWSDHLAALARLTGFLGIEPFQAMAPLHEFKGAGPGHAFAPSEDDLNFIADRCVAMWWNFPK